MLTRLIALISVVFALLAQSAFASTKALTRIESAEVFSENENYAIVIGVDEYDAVAPLNYAANDAKALGEFFESQDYSVTTLLNTQASKSRVLSKIKTVAAVAGSSSQARGNIVFVYSGHGFRENGVNYLAPSEIDPKRLTETGISLSEVSQILESANVRQRALFIDACRNDPGKSFANESQRFSVDRSSEGLAILYSTGAGKVSFEDTDLKAGVFSHYLLKGFEGGAAADDGLVSFNGVFGYVRNQVKKHVLRKYSKAQVPYMAGERSGEFVLARVDMAESSDLAAESVQFTVNRQPPGATVELTGSGLQYSDGMVLDPGKQYDIKVSHLGYDSFSTSYTPESGVQTLDVTLNQAVTAAAIPSADESLVEEKGSFLAAGANEPKKKSMWKVVGGVLAVAVIAGLAGGSGDSGSGATTTGPDPGDDPVVSISIQVPNP